MRYYAELVIYFILFITVVRVFVIKRVGQDSLVVLAPVAFVISLCYLWAYELSVFSIQVVGLSIIVLFINSHAIWRKIKKLFLDYYSPTMKVCSGIALILIFASFIFSVANHPYTLSNKKLDITVNKEVYTGSFRTGFTKPQVFDEKTLFITEYRSNMVRANPENVVVFIPDVRGDSTAYVPYLQLLASNGYTVCTADFFTSDCNWGFDMRLTKVGRSFLLTRQSINQPESFIKMTNTFAYNVRRGCDALLPILKEKYGKDCKFFFIADGLSCNVVKNFIQANESCVSGSFYFDTISEYKTSGYGCVEMTEPFVAKKLGIKKDKEGFITKYLVLKTSNAIIDAWSGL